ncbi:DUF1572 domain-containing protein [Chitinophaga sp. 22321]|uniref:DUF1572 domain-containing protein n=1 Tax=Chitinophaga hostae TaxID=2831022 RepID=A0ABS5IYY8_9BACT|nr:DUF1572 domain-containing protein [Chitinophaga hostae]MBS0028063.1 DUF1572 domain-containing protein [Chitinophaga hostae]
MNSTQLLSKHFRDVHFGGNWTSVNLKDTLAGVNRQQATTKVHDLNTIAVLVFHINYYVAAILKVFQGHALDAHDKFSFDLPAIATEEEWQALVDKTLTEATQLAVAIENLAEEKLVQDFADPKYGSYYRNILGVTEHTHYHLGQIAIIKKMVLAEK